MLILFKILRVLKFYPSYVTTPSIELNPMNFCTATFEDSQDPPG